MSQEKNELSFHVFCSAMSNCVAKGFNEDYNILEYSSSWNQYKKLKSSSQLKTIRLSEFIKDKNIHYTNKHEYVNDIYGMLLTTKKELKLSNGFSTLLDLNKAICLNHDKNVSPILNDIFLYIPRKVLIKKVMEFYKQELIDLRPIFRDVFITQHTLDNESLYLM